MARTNLDMYLSYTTQAGNICRQLALVGVGLIWLFHGIVTKGLELSSRLDPALFLALAFIVCSLFFDILQYGLGSYFWFNKAEADQHGNAKDQNCLILFATVCITIKLVAMFIAYVSIGLFLFFKPLLSEYL